MDLPDFRGIDWDNFQARLKDEIPLSPELNNGMANDTCVGNLSGTVLMVLSAFSPKTRSLDVLPFPIPAGIQDKIQLKNGM
jgi:hypothetical protein